MSLTRHEIREAEFLLLYEKMFNDEPLGELISVHNENGDVRLDGEIEKTVNEVLDKLPELDAVISEFSAKRSLERITKVNLCILRLAVFEILYRGDVVPRNAVVNEAVGLARAYGLEPDVRFVNGFLGAYTRSLESK